MFSVEEQKAILQCIWQTLQASPTENESHYVENLVSSGECMQNVDLSNIDIIRTIVDMNVKSWILVAVEEEPFETFAKVSAFSMAQKEAIKKIIIDIIEKCSDYSIRAPYAHTLFEKCNIPFKIVPRIFGNMVYNRLV